jgi:hypothetical protein
VEDEADEAGAVKAIRSAGDYPDLAVEGPRCGRAQAGGDDGKDWFSPMIKPDTSGPQSRESDDARSVEV